MQWNSEMKTTIAEPKVVLILGMSHIVILQENSISLDVCNWW